jgi:hypothetical protein
MLRRPLTRLVSAVSVAGTVCAVGAGAAFAAPAGTWSGPSRPIPGVQTNSSPALSTVTFPNPVGQGIIVAWRGRGAAGHIFYKYRTNSTHHWSHDARLGGALTSAAPAVGSYIDPLGRSAVLIVWSGHQNHHIWYSQGETKANGTISFTKPAFLPTSIRWASTFNAPTVFFPDHKNIVLVAWRGPANHVRYSVGVPAGRGFHWKQSDHVPGNPPSPSSAHCSVAPCTSATPAIAERSTSTSAGLIYVFWKQLGTRHLFYAATVDSHAANWSHLSWSGLKRVPGAVALTAPAAAVPRLNGTGSLLLAYKAPFSTHVRFQTLTSGTWSAFATVPRTRTAVAPALLRNILANTTPGTIGNVVLHVYG